MTPPPVDREQEVKDRATWLAGVCELVADNMDGETRRELFAASALLRELSQSLAASEARWQALEATEGD